MGRVAATSFYPGKNLGAAGDAGAVLTDDAKVGFKDANWCLLVGAKPRGPGMERADLLKDNGRIFITQGQVIDQVAAENARVAVVGNPANTNCMIAASQAKRHIRGSLHLQPSSSRQSHWMTY